jgi:hypothetical protein
MDSAPTQKELSDYRREARSIRAIASEFSNPKVKQQLFLIASLYDRLADLCEHVVRQVRSIQGWEGLTPCRRTTPPHLGAEEMEAPGSIEDNAQGISRKESTKDDRERAKGPP